MENGFCLIDYRNSKLELVNKDFLRDVFKILAREE